MKKIAILLASLMLVACASTKPANVTPVEPAKTAPAVANDSTAQAAALTPDQVAAAQLAEQLEQLHKSSVYFDYDKYNIKSEFRDTIEKHATVLKAGKAPVTLEGNCDERGSAAYNLALGEKRSSSVKKALVLMGVHASSIKVVSNGYDRPKLTCHEEKCWKENRRVDFVSPQK